MLGVALGGWAGVITSVGGAIISLLVTWIGRQLWKRVFLPVGKAAEALSSLAETLAEAQLIPEMNTYLHSRMHDIMNVLNKISLGQDTFKEEVLTLGELVKDLQDGVKQFRITLESGPPGPGP